eukprot:COSAG05_NODE_2341_length_3207_cov_1.628700_1_plen_469_part_10
MVEEADTATPNAVVWLAADKDTNLTMALEKMTTAMGTPTRAVSLSLQSECTLEASIEDIGEAGSSARASFEQVFVTDIAHKLGIDVSKVTIRSIQSGSLVVTFVIGTTEAAAVALAALEDALSGSVVAAMPVTGVGDALVAVAIDSTELPLTLDLSTALGGLNSAVTSGGIPGIPATQSVFQGLDMQCPAGFFAGAGGVCSRCPAGEEPDTARTGCVKCANRVIGHLQTWYSADGAQCELCPASKVPNDARTLCIDCEGNSYNKGDGKLCMPCPLNTVRKADGSGCRCDDGYYNVSAGTSNGWSIAVCHEEGQDFKSAALSRHKASPGLDDQCEPCPEGGCAECHGGSISVRPGFGIASSLAQRALPLDSLQGPHPRAIFSCLLKEDQCAGDLHLHNVTHRTLAASEEEDRWCKAGYIGPLCSNCDTANGYMRRGISRYTDCIDCSLSPTVLTMSGLACVIAAGFSLVF